MIKSFLLGVLLPFVALGLLVLAFGAGGAGALAPLGLVAALAFIGRRPFR